MNRTSFSSVFVVTFLLFARVTAQPEAVTLTYEDCIRMALASGPSIAVARSSYNARNAAYESFRSGLYPQFSLFGQAPGFNRSITSVIQPDGTSLFTPQSQASSTLSLLVSQQIPFTGGELSLSSGLNRVDLLESRAVFYRSTPLSLSYRQPLFQLNTLRWNMEAEDLRIQIARREWAEATEDAALDVTRKFFDAYVAAMNVENATRNIEVNDTLYQISVGRYNVGKIAENDLLQSELALLNARTQFANASIAYERTQNALAFAVGLPKGTQLKLIPPQSVPSMSLDASKALISARTRRSDVLTMRLDEVSADRQLTEAEFQNAFSATLTANAGLNQRAGTVPESYRNLLDQQQLSISFQVPIVQWGKGSSAVESALADKERVTRAAEIRTNSLDDEVRAQVSSLLLLSEQVGISAKADTIAERRFQVAKDRYLIGKIDVTNLFLAQSEKDGARRTRIQTLADFWSGYYLLRRLTLYDFVLDRPIDPPTFQ